MTDKKQEGMEKYGVDLALVDQLIAAGILPEEALTKVADGEGEQLLKEAQLRQKE